MTNMIMKNRETIKNALLFTKKNRDGLLRLINYMDEGGFFTSPCSSQYHLCEEGGLAQHSINVYNRMLVLKIGNLEKEMDDSVAIVSLLHDLGKMGQYGKPLYVENLVDSRKKDENGYKIFKKSESRPYGLNKDLLSLPHELRSLQIASQFIELTEDEQFAIYYHNGLYCKSGYDIVGKETPLQMLLNFADLWCSRVIEKKEGGNG